MDLRSQETPGKSSLVRHRDYNEGSSEHRPSEGPAKRLPQDDKRSFRRVRSPSRPRASLSGSFKPRFGGRFYRPHSFLRDERPFRKPGFGFGYGRGFQRYHHFNPHPRAHWRDQHGPPAPRPPAPPPTPSSQHSSEPRAAERSSPPKPKEHTGTPSRSSASSSSREKEKACLSFIVSKENEGAQIRDRGRERDPASTLSRAAARSRAIQDKRREIEEIYHQDSDTFGAVVRMLIAKDPALERPIQASLQENLKEIGLRCVEAMQTFIEEYDSRDASSE